MNIDPLKNWLASDESLSSIVGDRIIVGSLGDAQLPAIQINVIEDEDGDGVIQLDGWTCGDTAKQLATDLRGAIESRVKSTPPSIFSKVKIIRNDLVGVPRGPKKIDRRVSLDVMVEGVR